MWAAHSPPGTWANKGPKEGNLITGLTIKTNRLLEPGASTSLAVLLMHVRTRPTLGT